MPNLPDDIARINALTTNARTTWFSLIAVLLFVGITLLSVQHIDFYGAGRNTQLPFINVSVPTRLFFYSAPLLLAAIYCYFHLYLIRLIGVLAQAPARVNGARLGEAVNPWLVTDAMLLLRRWRRDDDCVEPRSGEKLSATFNFLLGWAFGLLVLWFCWQRSLPARSFYMSLSSVGAFSIAALFGSFSLIILMMRMRPPRAAQPGQWRHILLNIAAFCWFFALLSTGTVLTYGRTVEPLGPITLYPINLFEQQIVTRPADWLPAAIARAEFRASWCDRESKDCATLPMDEEDRFAEEWKTRREAQIAALPRQGLNPWRLAKTRGCITTQTHSLMVDLDEPTAEERVKARNTARQRLSGIGTWIQWFPETDDCARWSYRSLKFRQPSPDLRDAVLAGAFLPGANLILARLNGAAFDDADLERAKLMFADLGPFTSFFDADLTWADLRWAQMKGVDFSLATMKGANLSFAQMQGLDFSFAGMQGADFIAAQMRGVELAGTQMHEAKLDYAYFSGMSDEPILLFRTNLSAATNNGGALRFANLETVQFDEQTDFRNAFLDLSVKYTDAFARQMAPEGQDQPCQWAETELSDEAYFARWRWWIEAKPDRVFFENWKSVAPPEWRDVRRLTDQEIAGLGLSDCHWQTGPMPGADDS